MKSFPGNDKAIEGELLQPELAVDPLELPHAGEGIPTALVGGMPNPADLSPDWVLSRLMREANDFGSRTRQSSRVAALQTLAKAQGMLDDKPAERTTTEKLSELPPEQRRKLIEEKLKEMAKAGEIDLDAIRKRSGD